MVSSREGTSEVMSGRARLSSWQYLQQQEAHPLLFVPKATATK